MAHPAASGESLDQMATVTGRGEGAMTINPHRGIKAVRATPRQDPDNGR
jgi:hypothetical protein